VKGGGFVALVVLIVLVTIAFGVWSYYANQKRQKAFAAWAAANGFTYATRDDRYADLPWGAPFGVGFGRAALDVVTSVGRGRPTLCFTYRYKTQTSNGKTTSTQTHNFSIYSARLPKALPELHVGREGILSSLARAIGVHDIEFESEDFNREFKVTGDDRKLASDVINPPMMHFLLDSSAPGFTIVGTDILLAQSGRLDQESVLPTLAYLEAVIGRIPDFVWEAH
jgi:hypothetical protein